MIRGRQFVFRAMRRSYSTAPSMVMAWPSHLPKLLAWKRRFQTFGGKRRNSGANGVWGVLDPQNRPEYTGW